MGYSKNNKETEVTKNMISLLPKIILYNVYRVFKFPRIMPINYTISLLYECNSRCKTCNIYTKSAKNLTLSEYKLIFKRIGRSPYWMTLSGGEPFLREDLVDICKLIYKHNRPKIINIPTNGLLTDKIIESVKELTKFCKKSQLIVNLSIDGIAEQHDELRGVKGNYAKALKTYKALKEIKAKNLTVGIHTVISKFNVKSFPAIVDHLMILHPDSYITEIAEQRQELATMGEDISPTPIQYYTAIDYLIHRIKNAEDYKKSRLARITQAFRIEYYNLVKQILRDKTQVIPCFAGIASCQISPDGEIWSCCIKAKSMGNLREYDYKFKKIWFSKAMKKERKSIKDKECYCPLANANYTNLMLNIPTLLKVFYRSFIRWSK